LADEAASCARRSAATDAAAPGQDVRVQILDGAGSAAMLSVQGSVAPLGAEQLHDEPEERPEKSIPDAEALKGVDADLNCAETTTRPRFGKPTGQLTPKLQTLVEEIALRRGSRWKSRPGHC
jgi:hypothetical protein